MGTVMAIREGSNHLPGTPEDTAALLEELRAVIAELDVVNPLVAYGAAIQHF
jgi:hypothetical protein